MAWKDFAILHEDGYYTLATEETGDVPVRLFLTAQLLEEVEDNIYEQIVNATTFPGVKLVCITPDVHVGYGVPIGCVLVTDGTLCLGPVGYDIGCFTGDTLIPLADGKSYPIKELAEKREEFWAFAVTPEKNITVSKATAKKTRTNASLIKVVLDNEKEIICTPDHLFMPRKGEYKEAQNLTPGTSLMPFYDRYDEKGYRAVRQPKTGNPEMIHWAIARLGVLGKIPSFPGQKTVIHHKNFNPSDNRPENLEFMGDKDHARYHHENGSYNRHLNSEKFEQARIAALAAKAETEEGQDYFAERGTRNILAYMQERPEHFKQAVSDNGKEGNSTWRHITPARKDGRNPLRSHIKSISAKHAVQLSRKDSGSTITGDGVTAITTKLSLLNFLITQKMCIALLFLSMATLRWMQVYSYITVE